MKLIKMHIDDFGGMHDYDYSFDEGLNVVLQDNGWGKTTMAAFLKAMLYGYDARRIKDIKENERRRYLPWQGGKYGGWLEFESEGVRYRIDREFGETPRFDSVNVVNLNTNTTARIAPDRIGETLFHLDVNAFRRSVYIHQNGLSIEGAEGSIHARLNALVSQANDVSAFDGAIADLTGQVKIYEKTGARGRIGEITRQIEEKERRRDRMEAEIIAQDAERAGIIRIDGLMNGISQELEEKSKRLDTVSGEAKKREATQKQLEDLDGRIGSVKQKLTELEARMGGSVPAEEEIDRIKQRRKRADDLKASIRKLEGDRKNLEDEFKALTERYGEQLPEPAQLDRIQGLCGKIQGINAAGSDEAANIDVPREYAQVRSAEENAPGFVERLQAAVDSQSDLRNLMLRQDSRKRELQREAEAWSAKTKRYREFKKEAEEQREELGSRERFSPANAEPAIRQLETCRNRQQQLSQQESEARAEILRETEAWNETGKRYRELKQDADALKADADKNSVYEEGRVRKAITALEQLNRACEKIEEKKEALASLRLTAEEEAQLAEWPGELPDPEKGKDILNRCREETRLQADLQGLAARLDGEKSKEDSLAASAAQLEAAAASRTDAVAEPGSFSAGLWLGLGAALLIAGAVLALAVSPALGALAAVGILLLIYGVTGRSSHQKKREAYEAYLNSSALQQEAERKQKETEARLAEERTEIASLEAKIDALQSQIRMNREAIDDWTARWAPEESKAGEAEAAQVLERADRVSRLRGKSAQMESLRASLAEQTAEVEAERAAIDAAYPECAGKPVADALELLRAGETGNKIVQDKLRVANRALEKFVADAGLREEQFAQAEPPRMPELRSRLRKAEEGLKEIEKSRAEISGSYPEISELSWDEALNLLREKLGAYRVAESALRTCERDMARFVEESGAAAADLELPESPKAVRLGKELEQGAAEIEDRRKLCEPLLSELDLETDSNSILQSLEAAAEILNAFRVCDGKVRDKEHRQERQRQQLDELEAELKEQLAAIRCDAPLKDVPARLAAIREDSGKAKQMRAKMSEMESDLLQQKAELEQAEKEVASFAGAHLRAALQCEDPLAEISGAYTDYAAQRVTEAQLLNQREAAVKQMQGMDEKAVAEEKTLREEISDLRRRREDLLKEYTQKSDFIRQADRSLEQYPDLVREIHALYEQKQKDQNALSALKRTIQLIRTAKENLAKRYLGRVEELFNSYMRIWLNSDEVRGILDPDFRVSIEENGSLHVAEGYSTGYCDMIDFCMRLALVDTLFEKEQPFLILDDPFVNLDAEHLEKALELLNVMAADKQIVYFVCHPIRAVETEENSGSLTEFRRLSERARKALAGAGTGQPRGKAVVRKSPKEMYRVSAPASGLGFRPENPDYTITNSIFGMRFVTVEPAPVKDACYELFFIDEAGHVLNDRQMIEISGGKLSADRIQFSLNTREDSGDLFELMIRESGQDDYEVAARYPFRAKLTFTGTFDFGF